MRFLISDEKFLDAGIVENIFVYQGDVSPRYKNENGILLIYISITQKMKKWWWKDECSVLFIFLLQVKKYCLDV